PILRAASPPGAFSHAQGAQDTLLSSPLALSVKQYLIPRLLPRPSFGHASAQNFCIYVMAAGEQVYEAPAQSAEVIPGLSARAVPGGCGSAPLDCPPSHAASTMAPSPANTRKSDLNRLSIRLPPDALECNPGTNRNPL